MKDSGICYWCGAPASSDEHVPPKNLFPKAKRKNLITVRSCSEHNEKLTKEDELFRFYIQACSDSPESLKLFSDKTMRSFERHEAAKLLDAIFKDSHPVWMTGGETRALKVSPERQQLYFEKIIRGLFFHIFGRRMNGTVAAASPSFIAPSLDYGALSNSLSKYFASPEAIEGQLEQPEIFRYRYYFHQNGGREGFAIRMIFYSSVVVLGLYTSTTRK